MLFTPHVAVGAAIGAATDNPFAAFFIGFGAHFILDLIPHTDTGSYGLEAEELIHSPKDLAFIIGDITLGIIILLAGFIKTDFHWPVFWGTFGCLTPDLILNLPHTGKYIKQFFPFNYLDWVHKKVHYTILNKRYYWLGYLTQIVTIALALVFIFR